MDLLQEAMGKLVWWILAFCQHSIR